MSSPDNDDELAAEMYATQQQALGTMPDTLGAMEALYVPLRSYNMDSVANIRKMLRTDSAGAVSSSESIGDFPTLDNLIRTIHDTGKRVVFTMGKGGVGKTTIAMQIALGLKQLGDDVLLTTTDPANHLNAHLAQQANIEMAVIDEQKVLETYK